MAKVVQCKGISRNKVKKSPRRWEIYTDCDVYIAYGSRWYTPDFDVIADFVTILPTVIRRLVFWQVSVVSGLSHSMKVDNSSIERVEEFKYLGTTLTNQNSIQEEIKSRLKLGNACCHSAQNLLSSFLLSKNLKIKIYRTIILPVVLYGCETWSLTLRG